MTTMAHAWRNGVDYKFPPITRSKYGREPAFNNFPILTEEDEKLISYNHNQSGWTFDPLPYQPYMRLIGYYQNLNYFDEYRKELIEAFNLPKEKIDAVCVHVRRGDYARYPTKWPMLPPQYYQLAINISSIDESYIPIHVFSDEDVSKEWPCCKHFIGGDPLEDWLRMTQYKYFIIANSTYSWTAAYLSGSDNVIAPHHSKWYGKDNQHIFTGELIPKHWTEIKF